MLVTKYYAFDKSINCLVPNEANIRKYIEENYLYVYYDFGIIEDLDIRPGTGSMIKPCIRKRCQYIVNIMFKATMFTVPVGFAIPNAEVTSIAKDEHNQPRLIFKCNLVNLNGQPLKSSEKIILVIQSGGKSGKEIADFNSLVVGDIVNLTCEHVIPVRARKSFACSCTTMKKIEPFYFKATSKIAEAEFSFISDTDILKLIANLPEKATTSKLIPDRIYSMSPDGFREATLHEDTVDFINEQTDADHQGLVIGIDTLLEYMKALLDNWKFVAINNANLFKSGNAKRLIL